MARQIGEALALRARSLSSREIGERLHVAPSTVRGWLTDPDSAKTRERKHRYGGPCERCGSATTGNRPGEPRSLCRRCSASARRRWTRALVVGCIIEWRTRYGAWPQASDWHSTRAQARGGEAWRRWKEGRWPPASTVTRMFGRFEHAVDAAATRTLPAAAKLAPAETRKTYTNAEVFL
jgi:hypothetical protein